MGSERALELEKLVATGSLGFVVVFLQDGRKKLCDMQAYVALSKEELRGAEVRLLQASR